MSREEETKDQKTNKQKRNKRTIPSYRPGRLVPMSVHRVAGVHVQVPTLPPTILLNSWCFLTPRKRVRTFTKSPSTASPSPPQAATAVRSVPFAHLIHPLTRPYNTVHYSFTLFLLK